VDGLAAAREAPGVKSVFALEPGRRTHPLRSSGDRVTLATAAGATPAEALANAQRAVGLIEVKVRPAGADAPPVPD
jgi:hypothetical protein